MFDTCSVLSGYGRDCLDNELDMELDDEEEMDGFTEDRLDSLSSSGSMVSSIRGVGCGC